MIIIAVPDLDLLDKGVKFVYINALHTISQVIGLICDEFEFG
jgi:hypothetical protein